LESAEKRGSGPILIGVGAGVVIVIGLLVPQAIIPTFLVARTETTTSVGKTTALPEGNTSRTLFQVVFMQTPTCGDLKEYAIPWAVRLGNVTIVEPPNATLPDPSSELLQGGVTNLNLTRIIFLVPDGTYRYTVLPPGDFGVNLPGGNLTSALTVHGADTDVTVTPVRPGNCGF